MCSDPELLEKKELEKKQFYKAAKYQEEFARTNFILTDEE